MDIFKQISSNNANIGNKFTLLTSSIEANGLTVVDLLSSAYSSPNTSLPQLSKRLGRSIREVEEYLNELKQECTDASKQCNLKELLGQELTVGGYNCILTGLDLLDQQLNGGIPLGEITEIFGASGCGKSQLLLQLSIYSQRLGDPENNQCIYISTESPLETRRLQDMVDHHNSTNDTKVLMDNISCIYCQDVENLDHTLFTQLPVKLLQEKGKIRTIIIDSISHHLRMDDAISNKAYLSNRIKEQEVILADCKEYTEIKNKYQQQSKMFFKSTPKYQNRIAKSRYLMQLHRHLQSIARDNNIAVVIANQVSDYPDNVTDLSIFEDSGDALNLDYQLGQYSGWDNNTIFWHQQQYLQTQEAIATREAELAYNELMKSINLTYNLNKRQKTANLNSNPAEFDPRYRKNQQVSDIEDEHSNQVGLLEKLHKLSNCTTKKIVPALGYQWGKNIVSRIMLMKTYRPMLKEKGAIIGVEQAIDPETHLTYDSLCEGFELSTQDQGASLKRKAANQKTHAHHPSNTFNGIESLIDCWAVERYIKVTASPYELTTSNFLNENYKIPFKITTNGIEKQ